MKRCFAFGVALFCLFIMSCNNSGSFDINEYIQYDEDEYTDNRNEVRIPYTAVGGVRTVKCLLNGTILTDMILDSGCSGALISIEEARYLAAKGVLTEADFKGMSQSVIADGSIVENMVFTLRSVIIGDKIECTDVEVTVSANPGAPLLLGNEILGRLPQYTVDNVHQEIVFTIR